MWQSKWDRSIKLNLLTGCKLWTRGVRDNKRNQYPIIRHKRIRFHLHRLRYFHCKGIDYFSEEAKKIHVHHKCENKRCLNEEHLEGLSHSEHSKLHQDSNREHRAKIKTELAR